MGSDGVLIATPARTTSTDRGTIKTHVAGSFGNVAQCLVFLLDAAAGPSPRGFRCCSSVTSPLHSAGRIS